MRKRMVARVRRGHLLLDERVSLPDGTQLQLELADGTDPWDLSGSEALAAALRRGRAQIKAGAAVRASRALAGLHPWMRATRRYDVELSPQAIEHAVHIRTAFATTPASTPVLFADELDAAMCVLRVAPHI
jgi:hypothetical protein